MGSRWTDLRRWCISPKLLKLRPVLLHILSENDDRRVLGQKQEPQSHQENVLCARARKTGDSSGVARIRLPEIVRAGRAKVPILLKGRVNERRRDATTTEKRGLRGLLSSSERLSSAAIRTFESGLRVDVRTCAMASVVAMDEEEDGERCKVNESAIKAR
jgi:hypothetical protein